MGAGKSTAGRALAARFGVPFVDLDREIGDIPAIFARVGERGFRVREREVLARVSGGEGVLALGGGTVVDPVNLEQLAGWRVFVLTAPVAVLRERIGAGEDRPLASRLEELLAERADAYAKAGTVIETGGRTLEQVLDELEARCEFR